MTRTASDAKAATAGLYLLSLAGLNESQSRLIDDSFDVDDEKS